MQSEEWYERFMDDREESNDAPEKNQVETILTDMKEIGLLIPCTKHGNLHHADATAKGRAFYVVLNAIRKMDREQELKRKFEKMGFVAIPLDGSGAIESVSDLLDSILGEPQSRKQDKETQH